VTTARIRTCLRGTLLVVVMSAGALRADPALNLLDGAALFVRKDYERAYGLLLGAAEAGNARAQFMLASMYDAGKYVKQDGKVAAEWYRRAAEQGHADAQAILASKLSRGTDVPRDQSAAYQWASLAADRSYGSRREQALALTRSLAMLLSAEDLERAKAAAAVWSPRIVRVENRSIGTLRVTRRATGFFLNSFGTLLTNEHPVYLCPRIIVLYGDREIDGKLMDVDFEADLATVKTDVKPEVFARFALEGRPAVGTDVTVVGYAARQAMTRTPLTSSGVVLNPGSSDNPAWYRTSAPIYRGQSGSPAFDEMGRVVGLARGVQAPPHRSVPEAQDGEAIVVAVNSVSRFLARTKTPFATVSPDEAAAGPTPASRGVWIAPVQCLSD